MVTLSMSKGDFKILLRQAQYDTDIKLFTFSIELHIILLFSV
jgi:hypothetical protein